MSVLSGTAYLAALLLSGSVGAFMSVLAARYRTRRGSLALGTLSICFVVWSFAEAVMLVSNDLVVARNARLVMYTAIPFLPVALLVLALQYTGRDHWLSPVSVGLASLVPIVTVILAATNPLHELVWTPIGFVQVDQYTVYNVERNAWFWIHLVYSYLLLVIGTYIFIRGAIDKRDSYSMQSRAILIGIAVPWIANLITIFGPWDLVFDLTPIFFTVSGVFLGIAVLRYQFLDLIPIARDSVVEELREAVIVLDDIGRVADANPVACNLLGASHDDLLGKPFETVAPESLVAAADHGAEDRTVRLQAPEGPRRYEVRQSSLPTGGQVLLLYDVTELRAQAIRLERQNQRLERFASVLSHDLRNPLNVAQGYVDLLEARGEANPDHVKRVDDALDRIETLVVDTLDLTREGQIVAEPHPVSIGDTAKLAWDNVVTGAATLEVDLSLSVLGDTTRVQRLFENLFRNAVEHATAEDGSLTVTISETPDGFAVTDTGPGIPPEKREDVFEFGFTTAETGTGLGLSMVAEIAQAHGWQLTLSDAENGGCRFEFSNVETVDDEWLGDVFGGRAPDVSSGAKVGSEAGSEEPPEEESQSAR